eukprot:gene11038-11193_t
MEADLARDVAAAVAAESSSSNSSSSRRGLHLVVMGHVDAGKSTLMGRLLHDLGQVSQKVVHKNQKEAAQAGKGCYWARQVRPGSALSWWIVQRAVQLYNVLFNSGFGDWTEAAKGGHRDFVPNMISGAAQADAALLLVDGSPGGFEAGFAGGGQTQEHAQLARSLGVEQMAVVISKLDTCDYSQERFDYIRAQLLPFLKSVGFKESGLQWLPAVGPAGQNLIARPSEPLLASWWKGPTLVQAIDAFVPKPRNTAAPFRLAVHDVFKGRQGGLCVGGKVEGGAVKPGSKVLITPGHDLGTIKSIDLNGQERAPVALSGDSPDLVLTGLEPSAVHAGAVLCHPEFPVRLAVKFTAQVLVLQVPLPILKGQAVTVHAHTAREAGVVSALLGLCDSRTGRAGQRKPRCLLSGQTALIEVTPVRPLPLEVFSDVKALGRIALREGGRTVAVGIVTGITE